MPKSLASLMDKAYIQILTKSDPSTAQLSNYLVNSADLSDQFGCKASVCEHQGEEAKNKNLKCIICFCCNLVYHVDCVFEAADDVKQAKLPYKCPNCEASPDNEAAMAFAAKLDKAGTMLERKQQFLDVGKMLKRAQQLENKNSDYQKQLDDAKKQMELLTLQLKQQVPAAPPLSSTLMPPNPIFNVSSSLDTIHESSTSSQFLSANSETQLDSSKILVNSMLSRSNLPKINIESDNTKQKRSIPFVSTQYTYHLPDISEVSQEEIDTWTPQERIARDQIVLSHATATAQLELNHRATLESCRKALPKITKFNGNPKLWLRFKNDVNRELTVGKYEETLVKFHVRAALEGQALNRVEALIDICALQDIMNILENSFGNPDVVIEAAREEVSKIVIKGDLTRDKAVEINTVIQGYKFACQTAKLDILDSHYLAKKIINQLSSFHKQGYRAYCRENHPTSARIEDLKILYAFLENLMKDLEPAPFVEEKKAQKAAQVLSTSAAPSLPKPYVVHTNNKQSSNSNEDYKYEIQDKSKWPYMGYDLEQVNSIAKSCLCCGRGNHFLIECRTFKSLDSAKKRELISAKKACRNCLLTSSHDASQCKAKLGCGAKVGNGQRCSQKHHVILHDYRRGKSNFNSKRRSNTNHNNERANEKLAQQQASSSTSNEATSSASAINNTSGSCGYIIQSDGAVSQVIHEDGQSNMITCIDEEDFDLNKLRHDESKEIAQLNYNIKNANHDNAQSKQMKEKPQRTVKVFRIKFYNSTNSKYIEGFAIGDSGSELTLVRADLIKALEIEGTDSVVISQYANNTFGYSNAKRIAIDIKGIHADSKMQHLDVCDATDDLRLATRSLDVDQLKQLFSYLRDIDFKSYFNATPVMLIGSRYAHMMEAIEGIKENGPGNPVGMKTKLGFTIYGGSPEIFNQVNSISSIDSNLSATKETERDKVNHVAKVELNEKISTHSNKETSITNEQLYDAFVYFCSIESLGIKNIDSHITDDEKKAVEILEEEMRQLPDGSIEVPLIWNRNNKVIPSLPNNAKMVYKRQIIHEQKLAKNPVHLKAFNDNFIELLNQGYVREATSSDIETEWPNIWYIPMSLVINQNKDPVAYRNVYDAPARYQGTSLNENLLMGPNLLVDMLKPLMRMRVNQIAFTADVKSMFHRIHICPRDQQCQRIMWRKSTSEPMKIYVQQRMLFGPKCSPFTSQYVKNKTAEKFQLQYPEAANTLINYTYMDDVLTSEAKVSTAIELANQCIHILKTINWDLIGFKSNSVEFLKNLPESHVKKDLLPLMSMEEETYTTKVLGAAWDTKSDAFVYQLNKNAFIKLARDFDYRPTKRDQCSTIARIFDILGFISHCLIRGRILLQRSWKQKIGWDEKITEEDYKLWKQWLKDLEQLSNLKIPRQHLPARSLYNADRLEIHAFCDAGKEAIAAVSYIVSTYRECRYVSILLAKAKVAPIKIKTKTEISEMPRLELTSCLIASRLIDTVTRLHPSCKFERYLWSDSEIALNWIKNGNIKLPRFAISPVEEIIEKTKRDEWRYVQSSENPADAATKFSKINFGDINSIWFTGPAFLKLPQHLWPKQKALNKNVDEYQVNCIGIPFESQIQLPNADCPFAGEWIIEKFSNGIKAEWIKLVRAVARALKLLYDGLIPALKSKKFLNKVMRKEIKSKAKLHILKAIDYERAELFIIRKMQREVYKEEYNKLVKGQNSSNKELQELAAFVDDQGIIRINSRVALPIKMYPQRFSPLVPRKASLSDTLLLYYHTKFNHICLEAQVASFRASFWMPQLRAALRDTKFDCNYCKVKKAAPTAPIMAPLPEERIDPSLKPFQITGLDCTGSYTIHTANGRAKKVWLLLFTCTLTRYIHVHILESMDTTHLLEAIASFWNAHGPVTQFISDNGTNFVGASKIIARALEIRKDELSETLAEKYRLTWQFIPVTSPWFGAFYERLIKEIKRAINGTFDKKKINKIEFSIAVQDACHRINCRPLTQNPISCQDEEVLTPHHLAKGRSGWPLLPSIHRNKENPTQCNDRSLYAKGRKLADEMMRKFTSYYLPVLTKRTKWLKETTPLAVGELVLLINPNETREQWKRGIIRKLYKGRDGRCRVADIETSDGVLRKNRSVQRLARLNVQSFPLISA